MRLAVLAVLVLLGLASVSLPTVAGETNMVPIISFFITGITTGTFGCQGGPDL
jgi:hypothetical protein